ncbi:MAG: VCBS repeat-containing protein, partial [Muribaculaceae bacterium]|nr:VCBS repeat-containing protein [Muribaculaceae bacterium]
TWTDNEASKDFFRSERSGPVVADFNNDDNLDIYDSGNGKIEKFGKVGGFWFQLTSSMYYNNGDGTWTIDGIDAAPTGNLKDDGETEEWAYTSPKHNIAPARFGHNATIDFDNDGLVDLLIVGEMHGDDQMGWYHANDRKVWHSGDGAPNGEGWYTIMLYKNLGDGRFERIEDCNLPIFYADDCKGQSSFMRSVAWGDYDRDGYVDFAFSGIIPDTQPGEPGRMAQLWRNIDGTGKFEQMNIAETRGGTWTNAVTEGDGDDRVEVIPSRQLEGWFLLLSGQVTMVDVNNDGWLDLMFEGWADKMGDNAYENGSNARLYINQEGKKFVDATDPNGGLAGTRSGSSVFVDIDGDGYLDYVTSGYYDRGGYKAFIHYNTGDPENPYDNFVDMANYGLPAGERYRIHARDFDNDGYVDFFFDGDEGEHKIYSCFGGENYQGFAIDPVPFLYGDARNSVAGVGDFNNDGLADYYRTGWNWIQDDFNGTNLREMFGQGEDWIHNHMLMMNTTDTQVEAPVAPEGIETLLDEDAKTLTVKWEDTDDSGVGYNVVVVTPSNKVVSILPVNTVTGFVKVGDNKQITVRPGVQEYTLPYNEVGNYKVGVQAVSLLNEKSSAIAWGPELSSVGTIVSDMAEATVKVTVNGNVIVANADTNAEVKIVDMMGRTIATGVTNAPINVEANGVLIVTVAGQSVKIVK